MSDDTLAALSFGPAAARYDELRPGYPEPALRWALGDPPARVLDLGAGTGILSRALAAAGYDVVPVEPDDAMRAQFTAANPGLATPLAGYAERIPLPDASVDGVTAGQAYHWFDREPAHAEIARVLRPGGVFAPMWNRWDESEPWVAELAQIADDGAGGRRRTPGAEPFGPAFGPVEQATFTHAMTFTPDSLVGLASTHSRYLTATPDRQREIARRIRELCATHPELAGRTSIDLPHQTAVWRGTRSRA
jgi:SAM-dependent methyltransferase